MSIEEYKTDSGEKQYRVKVSRRSNRDPSIRIQKMKLGISSYELARKVESALKEEAVRAVVEREHQGCTWGKLVDEWELALTDPSESIGASTTAEDYIQVLRTWTP